MPNLWHFATGDFVAPSLEEDQGRRLLALAQGWAQTLSRDRSTRVGAFFVNPATLSVVTRGYNGMPRGVDEAKPERHERPAKYDYFEHAERNAIFNSLRPLLGDSVALLTNIPEMADVRALVSVGARIIAFSALFTELPRDWESRVLLAAEAGAAVYRHDASGWNPLTVPQGHPGMTAAQSRKLPQFLREARRLAQTMGELARNEAAMLLHPDDFTVLAEGWAEPCRGISGASSEDEAAVESAVRTALYRAANRWLAGTTAIVTLMPCVDCARALIAVGVREVIVARPEPEVLERWRANFEQSLQLFSEHDVLVRELSPADG